MNTINVICNKVSRRVNSLIHLAFDSFCTCLEISYLRLIGVRIGGKCVFRGFCSVFYADNSSISIGSDNEFNSSLYSNHLGLSHRCIISTFNSGAVISIGNGCGFSGASISCFSSITIGNNVRIGADVVIMDGDFHNDDSRAGHPAPVVICDDVWIGAGVKILKGVTIGKGSVVGAGSIVTRDIPPYSKAAGVPCDVLSKY